MKSFGMSELRVDVCTMSMIRYAQNSKSNASVSSHSSSLNRCVLRLSDRPLKIERENFKLLVRRVQPVGRDIFDLF